MNNFNPSIRKPEASAPIAATNSAESLVGKSLAELIADCQWKLMTGRGKNKTATGEYFLNCVTPKLFAANLDETEIHSIPQVYANFDNMEGSVGVALAQHLSSELLKTGVMPELQYYFKLIDSKTKLTIATDMPEREQLEANELPDFLKPSTVSTAPEYIPDSRYCAFLHIYAERDGVPVRIASSDIEARFADQVAVVSRLVANGNHIQASVVPQAKVATWLDSQAVADKVEESLDIADCATVAEA
jgi:hypothetical protein